MSIQICMWCVVTYRTIMSGNIEYLLAFILSLKRSLHFGQNLVTRYDMYDTKYLYYTSTIRFVLYVWFVWFVWFVWYAWYVWYVHTILITSIIIIMLVVHRTMPARGRYSGGKKLQKKKQHEPIHGHIHEPIHPAKPPVQQQYNSNA